MKTRKLHFELSSFLFSLFLFHLIQGERVNSIHHFFIHSPNHHDDPTRTLPIYTLIGHSMTQLIFFFQLESREENCSSLSLKMIKVKAKREREKKRFFFFISPTLIFFLCYHLEAGKFTRNQNWYVND